MEKKRYLEAEERERAIRAREEAEEERRKAAERVMREKERQQVRVRPKNAHSSGSSDDVTDPNAGLG